jgi:sugar lactone lactonase YvrE
MTSKHRPDTFALLMALLLVQGRAADAGGSPLDATIGSPGAVTTDTHGNVYFSSSPGLVFKLDGSDVLSTIAGGWTPGFAGDGGPGVQARLAFPLSYPELLRDPIDFAELVGALTVDAAGNIYVADAYNNRVRKIDAAGTISTVAGTGPPGWPGGQQNGGTALTTSLAFPQGLAVDDAGNLYIADQGNTPLRRMLPDGTLQDVTDNNCGLHLTPGLCAPEQIATGQGAVFVTDGYCDVRRFAADGTMVEVAGDSSPSAGGANWTCGYSGDGGPATSAALSYPYAVAVDALGNLYVADTYNSCIRKVDTTGIISTIAGMCQSAGYTGDGGPALAAKLNQPHGVAVDAAGNLFVADTANNRVRRVAVDGTISTVAGNGSAAPIELVPTTTDLIASALNVTPAESLTLTATVSGIASQAGFYPAGLVSFQDGGRQLAAVELQAGASSALLRTGPLAPGAHSFTAVFSGNLLSRPSTSPAVQVAVMQGPVPPPPSASTTSSAPIGGGGAWSAADLVTLLLLALARRWRNSRHSDAQRHPQSRMNNSAEKLRSRSAVGRKERRKLLMMLVERKGLEPSTPATATAHPWGGIEPPTHGFLAGGRGF